MGIHCYEYMLINRSQWLSIRKQWHALSLVSYRLPLIYQPVSVPIHQSPQNFDWDLSQKHWHIWAQHQSGKYWMYVFHCCLHEQMTLTFFLSWSLEKHGHYPVNHAIYTLIQKYFTRCIYQTRCTCSACFWGNKVCFLKSCVSSPKITQLY